MTKLEQKVNSSTSVYTNYVYDSYGNQLSVQDPNGNTTSTSYDTTYNMYPVTKTYPDTGLTESYTYDTGTTNLLTQTDVNGQVTTYAYDTFKRLTSVDKPGGRNPDITYEYLNWGTINQQQILTKTYYDASNYLWSAEYFDGLGRVIQTQNNGETGHTIVANTTAYNNCGQVANQYVSQDFASVLTTYQTPGSWNSTSYTYDGLGRVLVQTNPDGTQLSNDYSNAWETTVTDALGHKKNYYYDAYQNLTKVQEQANTYDLQLKWGAPLINNGYFNLPYNIAIDGQGNTYVADTYNQRIQKFDASGNFVTNWGTLGNGSGQFNNPQAVAIDSQGNIYVADTSNNRIQKFDASGNFLLKWGSSGSTDGKFSSPRGIAVDSADNIYVSDYGNNRIQKFSSSGTFVTKWGTSGIGDGQFASPRGLAVDTSNNVYVTDTGNNRIQKFDLNGTFISKWGSYGSGNGQLSAPYDIDIDSQGNAYVADSSNNRIQKFNPNGTYLSKWGSYGTGDVQFKTPSGIAIDPVNSCIYIADYYNSRIQKYSMSGSYLSRFGGDITADGRFNLPYGIARDNSGNIYVADYYNSRIQKFDASGNFISKWGSYGTGNGQFKYPRGIAVDSQGNLYVTDSSNKRIQKFDLAGNYLSQWGTSGSGNGQFSTPWGIAVDSSNNIYVVDSGNNRIQKFDSGGNYLSQWGTAGTGNGQFSAPNDIVIDSSGMIYITDTGNNRIQKFNSDGTFSSAWGSNGSGNGQFKSPRGIAIDSQGNIYLADDGNHRIQEFDSSGTFLQKFGSRGTGDGQFSDPYDLILDPGNNIYVLDTYNHRVQKFSLSAAYTTNYTYDVLGNLTQVVDNANNTTTMTYNRLSQKTAMSDPDMGSWSYGYDNNGNLTSQTDAKNQTISMVYDNMNRLTNKNYPAGSGMTNIVYTYDAFESGVNYGKGKRTGMTDAAGVMIYKYDERGRQKEETRLYNTMYYTTKYSYDFADRLYQTIYPNPSTTYPTPNGETVTQAYNGRGLPNTLSGTAAGSLVSSINYNALGLITQIILGNTLKTTYGYYGTGGANDTTGGYYGKLWEIKTLPQAGGTSLQDVKHTWDAVGNLSTKQDVLASETETFTYDFLDRLTGVSGPYTESFTYNTIGNLTSKNGTSYTYGDSNHKHAVTAVGSTSYVYDANGNMTNRGSQTITWDVENRPITVSGGVSFVYDGDGNRIQKTEGGQTILYINKYYEINVTTSTATSNYYLGGKLIAEMQGSNPSTGLTYVHQDALTGTSLTTNYSGGSTGTIKYFSFGQTRSGTVSIEQKFTGQRLDATGLYYYNARYYDPAIGRFISPDKYIQTLYNPQSLNRYTYCINNPLKYIDPSGNFWDWIIDAFTISFDVHELVRDPSWSNAGYLVGDIILGIVPFVPAGIGPGVKTVKAIDKTIEGAKETRQIERSFKSFTQKNFRENLKILTGKSDDAIKGMQAHHTLPTEYEKDFAKAGLDINDPKFGTWVDFSHQNWSKAYNDEWKAFFTEYKNPTKEQILGKAKELGNKYEFEVNFSK